MYSMLRIILKHLKPFICAHYYSERLFLNFVFCEKHYVSEALATGVREIHIQAQTTFKLK